MKRNSFTYNQADIQRYVNGEMSREEMRQMELAALDDPFLADALEGYMQANETVSKKHISEIKAHILNKEDDRKVIPLFRKYSWLSAAAVIIIIAGAAWLSLNLLNKPSEELAENKQTVAVKKDSAVQPVNENKIAPVEKIKDATVKQQDVRANKLRREKSNEISEMNDAEEKVIAARQAAATAPESRAMLRAQQSMPTAVANERAERDMNKNIANITGTVKDEAGKPIAGASVNVGKFGTTTDANGNFRLPVADSNVVADFSMIGKKQRSVQLNNGNNEVVLEKGNETLSEVVVTAMGTARKRSVTSVETTLEIDTIGVQTPVIGWKYFRTKLIGRLKQSSVEQHTEKTIISFVVNDNRSIRRIRTEETDNEDLADKITDFIQSEEFWMPSKERIRLVIRIK